MISCIHRPRLQVYSETRIKSSVICWRVSGSLPQALAGRYVWSSTNHKVTYLCRMCKAFLRSESFRMHGWHILYVIKILSFFLFFFQNFLPMPERSIDFAHSHSNATFGRVAYGQKLHTLPCFRDVQAKWPRPGHDRDRKHATKVCITRCKIGWSRSLICFDLQHYRLAGFGSSTVAAIWLLVQTSAVTRRRLQQPQNMRRSLTRRLR